MPSTNSLQSDEQCISKSEVMTSGKEPPEMTCGGERAAGEGGSHVLKAERYY